MDDDTKHKKGKATKKCVTKIIHQTLTLEISLVSTKHVLLNHILFWLMMISCIR